MRGLDVSFAAPPPEWWLDRHREGWRVFVQDGWTGIMSPKSCRQNLYNARQAGFVNGVYTCTNNWPGAESVNRAADACGPEWDHVEFVPIDVEIAGVEVMTMLRHTGEALQRVSDLRKKRCIYTAHWYWVGHLGNPTDFKGERLWNAYYDGEPDYDFWRAPYGGWTLASLMGEQYAGTTHLSGHAVDLNEFEQDFIAKEERMPKIIKGSGPTHYVTDGVHKWAIPTKAMLNELREKGLVEGGVITVSDALLQRIRNAHEGAVGSGGLTGAELEAIVKRVLERQRLIVE